MPIKKSGTNNFRHLSSLPLLIFVIIYSKKTYFGHLDNAQKIIPVYYVDGILLIRVEKQEMASTPYAFARYVHARKQDKKILQRFIKVSRAVKSGTCMDILSR